jgi:hypothetical protein
LHHEERGFYQRAKILPSVAGDGIRLLREANIEVDYYDKKFNEIIAKETAIDSARIMVDVDGEKVVVSSPGIPLWLQLKDFGHLV